MDLPIPAGTYSGEPTPFGGPSLEWELDNNPILLSKDGDNDARISVRRVPSVIIQVLCPSLKKYLRGFPQTAANVERQLVSMGIPIISEMVSSLPSKLDEALRVMQDGPDDPIMYSFSTKSRYPFRLGELMENPHSIRMKSWEDVEKVNDMSNHVGVHNGDVSIICMAASLAQSKDPKIVPIVFRNSFISEVKNFQKWLLRRRSI